MGRKIISNSSHLIALSILRRLHLLWELFDPVYIPKAVYDEIVLPDGELDVVGITANTAAAPHAYSLASEFRKRGVKVVLLALSQAQILNFDSTPVTKIKHIGEYG